VLNNLKNSIRKQQLNEFVTEAALEHTDDDLKDMFLDDDIPSDDENDPELSKIIDSIPEYEDADISDADLTHIEENFIPETKI